MLKRAFVSFDYDHDESLKHLLIGQSKHSDTPFNLADWSIKEHVSGDWLAKARSRIRSVDFMIVLCGLYTDKAAGVNAELRIAQEEGKPYFLLKGYADYGCRPPATARPSDKIYRWTWDNLKALVAGYR